MGPESAVVIDAGTAFSLASLLYLLSATAATIHVLLNKQNVSAAFSWIGLIILSPFFGVTLYWLFGINRIRKRVRAVLRDRGADTGGLEFSTGRSDHQSVLSSLATPQQQLLLTGLSIHASPYLRGNRVETLLNGVAAFPMMLEAIAQARKSIVLSSYIFEYDLIGKQFVTALIDAHQRGVRVYVLIDGVGVGYGFSLVKADRVLRKHHIATARFLPTFSPSGSRFINLRNHRKILSVDGENAFVGGMNIRAGNLLDGTAKHQTQDTHFRVQGPAIDQINRVFEDDWQFASGLNIELPRWSNGQAGDVICRVLLDGPDDNFQKLELTLIAAINSARQRICIATPYFLPDVPVIHALQLAVLRGVDVRLLIPEKNNLIFVEWAMRANEAKLLQAGIKIYRSQPPFDHSKLFVVDGCWSLIGSSNWDARSIFLNFEINVECFDKQFALEQEQVLNDKFAHGSNVTRVQRSLLVRLRNNFFRLFTPYL